MIVRIIILIIEGLSVVLNAMLSFDFDDLIIPVSLQLYQSLLGRAWRINKQQTSKRRFELRWENSCARLSMRADMWCFRTWYEHIRNCYSRVSLCLSSSVDSGGFLFFNSCVFPYLFSTANTISYIFFERVRAFKRLACHVRVTPATVACTPRPAQAKRSPCLHTTLAAAGVFSRILLVHNTWIRYRLASGIVVPASILCALSDSIWRGCINWTAIH